LGSVLFAGLVLIGSLSACEGVKRSLGLERSPPDEFAVVPHRPLTVPPDFALTPPTPGESGPREASARDKAAAAVFGSVTSAGGARGQGEEALLKAAGAEKSDHAIRRTIDREFSTFAREDEGFFESLLFWRTPGQPGEPVDASAEAKRLQENAALGKPSNDGETPVIKKHEKALLEGIF
jgi:hypothetical protein